jgi:hypothetical protein
MAGGGTGSFSGLSARLLCSCVSVGPPGDIAKMEDALNSGKFSASGGFS